MFTMVTMSSMSIIIGTREFVLELGPFGLELTPALLHLRAGRRELYWCWMTGERWAGVAE